MKAVSSLIDQVELSWRRICHTHEAASTLLNVHNEGNFRSRCYDRNGIPPRVAQELKCVSRAKEVQRKL